MSQHNDYNDYVKTNNAGKYMTNENGSGLMDIVWFMIAVCLMLVIMQIE